MTDSLDVGARRLRILNVISVGEEAGGAESHVALVNRVLRRRGHEVRTLASDVETGTPTYADRTFRAIPLQGVGKLVSTSWNRHAAAAVRDEIRTFHPEIVVVHTMQQLSPAVLVALRHVPTVVCIHGPEHFTRSLLSWSLAPSDFKAASFDRRDLTPMGRVHLAYFRYFSVPAYRVGLRYANRIVTFSAFLTTVMASEGLETTFLQMGVPLLAPAPLDPDNSVVLYAGRIEVIKGVFVLLEAFRQVKQAVPEARLRIAGSGTGEDDLRRRITAAGLDDCVDLVGHVAAGDMERFYASGSVVALPSIFAEAFGKVGPEAMSVGRPVVASVVGGVLEWLRPEINGLAFHTGNAGALASALTRLLRDRLLLARLAKGAQETALQFDIELHVDNFEQLLMQVVDEAASATPS